MARPFIPALNTAKMDLIYLHQGVRCMNTWWARYPEKPDEERLSRLADTMDSWITSYLSTILTVSLGFESLELTEQTEPGSTFFEKSVFGAGSGQLNEFPMPLNVSLVVRWNTGFAGRSRRGRTYLTGLPIGAQTSTAPSFCLDAYRDNVQGVFDALRLAVLGASGGPELVVASFREDNDWRSDALLTPITGVEVNRRFDTMRKRLPEA